MSAPSAPFLRATSGRKARRLALVEFDVPEVAAGSTEHLAFLVSTDEQGLAEYDGQRELLAQGS